MRFKDVTPFQKESEGSDNRIYVRRNHSLQGYFIMFFELDVS